jgi:hypothetical protein
MATTVEVVRAQAQQLAASLLSTIQGRFSYTDLRAAALDKTLETFKPGTSAKVQAWAKAYQAGGIAPADALQAALTKVLEAAIWNAAEQAPGQLGCCAGLGDAAGIINGISAGLTAAMGVATGIYTMVQDGRDRNAERSAASSAAQAATQAAPQVIIRETAPATSGIPTWGWVAGAAALAGGGYLLLSKKR